MRQSPSTLLWYQNKTLTHSHCPGRQNAPETKLLESLPLNFIADVYLRDLIRMTPLHSDNHEDTSFSRSKGDAETRERQRSCRSLLMTALVAVVQLV